MPIPPFRAVRTGTSVSNTAFVGDREDGPVDGLQRRKGGNPLQRFEPGQGLKSGIASSMALRSPKFCRSVRSGGLPKS